MNKVPVILISGFLGSGKTTLLLRLLAHTRQIPLRPAVLMNEMGEYDVDGAIISEEMPDVSVEGLLEGCICCSKRSELAGALHTLLSQEPDLIFMETTGVANPEQVLEELRSPLLADRLYLAHSISVVDAELFHEYNSRFTADKELVRTLHGQLRTADFIVVNKTDAASAREVTKVVKSIRKLNDTVPSCKPLSIVGLTLNHCWSLFWPPYPLPQNLYRYLNLNQHRLSEPMQPHRPPLFPQKVSNDPAVSPEVQHSKLFLRTVIATATIQTSPIRFPVWRA